MYKILYSTYTRYSRLFIVIVPAIALFVITSSMIRPPLNLVPQTEQVVLAPASSLYVVAYALPELVRNSDIIVIAKLLRTDMTENMARNQNDLSQPDSDMYIDDRIYRVAVEEYVKGRGSGSLLLMQPEAYFTFLAPQTPDPVQLDKARKELAFIPNASTNYLLFLRSTVSIPGYYVGAIEPWLFDLSDPNAVVPDSPWSGAIKYFPARPLASMLNEIRRLILIPSASF